MRLDLFLKNTGLIVRRAVAKRACDEGLVEVNGKSAKASHPTREGDRIVLRVRTRVTEHEVLRLPARAVPKPEREEYVRLVSSERAKDDPPGW